MAIEEGVKYFFKHSKKTDKEITLYCALDLVRWMGEDELWIKVYEYGLSKRITPRDSLIEEYKKRQEKTWRNRIKISGDNGSIQNRKILGKVKGICSGAHAFPFWLNI